MVKPPLELSFCIFLHKISVDKEMWSFGKKFVEFRENLLSFDVVIWSRCHGFHHNNVGMK